MAGKSGHALSSRDSWQTKNWSGRRWEEAEGGSRRRSGADLKWPDPQFFRQRKLFWSESVAREEPKILRSF